MIKEKNSENGIKTTYMKTVIKNKKTFESMKKHFIYATLSAIALFGAVSFSACSSSEDVAEDINPTYDGNSVKTQFTISFPENVAKTRQSSSTVQATNNDISNFRGMQDIILYPFAITGTAGNDPINYADPTNPIASTLPSKLGGAIQLTKLVKPSDVALGTTEYNTIPASSLTAASNSVVYEDVSIPVGTGSFLFYGKAKDNGDKVVNGSLVMTGDEPATIKFTPEQIYSGTTLSSSVGIALAAYLTQIAQAGGMTGNQSAWEATTNESLKELYNSFITLKAGSSLTAQAAVQDLYATIKNNTDAVSVAIKDAILSDNSVTAHGYTVTYATVNTTSGLLDFESTIGAITNTTTGANTYFPGDIGLPDGAALLEYNDATNTFTQKINGSGNTGANITAKYADYVYPASLYYYSNSGIKTATSSQKGLHDGTNTWTQITSNALFTGTSVGTSTRSVAILDPIQYAVGRLDARITCAAATLYDKKGEEYNASAGFRVTGILIGGQKEVNYDFTTTTSTEAPIYTIYDNVTKSLGTIDFTTTNSAPNYTLALETAKNASVYVAVELLNLGEDFEGYDGVVPKGCKFYLVGELNPANATAPTGSSTPLDQVFKQDYYTQANFTIQAGLPKTDNSFNSTTGNTTGLGKAYNTIPDLRSPSMELGLSVNLEWVEGNTFTVTF